MRMGSLGRSSRGLGAGAAWLAGAIAIAGCGRRVPHSDKPWSQAHVTVTAGGRPVTAGDVNLMAKPESNGLDAGGRLDARGTAVIPVLPGRYVAVILPLPPAPSEPGEKASRGTEPAIPSRYRSSATSPFEAEVRANERNVFTFDMGPAASAKP
jgi:hypothetical protein